MGAVPTTVNKTLGTAETIINDVVMKGLDPVTVQLVTAIPALSFLKIWPLSALFQLLVDWIYKGLSYVMQVTGVKLVVTIQTTEEQGAYLHAEGALRAALLTGDSNAISKAKQDMDSAIDALVHYDGSSPISTG